MIDVEKINKDLLPKSHLNYQLIDLFAGCGGLSLGFEAVGFKTLGYEMDSFAAKTYNQNLIGNCIEKKLDTNIYFIDEVDIIIGGPPCQPFSFRGKSFRYRENFCLERWTPKRSKGWQKLFSNFPQCY